MQKITPFLWFDHQAEEAMNYYISIFRNSKVLSITRYGEEGPGLEGTVMTVRFMIEGQEFVALNGGPMFSFSPAISFVVNCKTQEEIDEYWRELSEGGEVQGPGWVKDKYGLSWQITPTGLEELMNAEDPIKSQRVMQAMQKMGKINIKTLKEAYKNE